MRRFAGALAAFAFAAGAAAQEPEIESPEALPEGPGREETFYRCTACHSTAIIKRTALSRERWDELMDWMAERQGMPPLDEVERPVIVDYLAKTFPPRRPRRGGNPFGE